MLTDEKALVEQAKTNPEDFGILYERYVNTVYNFIYYRVGNHHDAEDLTARTFHKALDNIEGYENRGTPFCAWLYCIARNLVSNWHRDASRREILPLEAIRDTDPCHNHKRPDQEAEKNDEVSRLVAVIQRLPSDRQQLLILKFVERMSNAEIGKVMGRSEGAIKSLYYRTLKSLRKVFNVEECTQDVDQNKLRDLSEGERLIGIGTVAAVPSTPFSKDGCRARVFQSD